MTGATSGFGQVIARHLVQEQYTLLFFARSEEKAKALKQTLMSAHPAAQVQAIPCDLASFHSVESACRKVRESVDRIDLMIHNAGIMNFTFKESADGIEETLQVNLLAPLLILYTLKKLIPKNGASKILFTSSGLHQGTIQFNKLEFRDAFSSFKTYRQSKLGIILMTRLLASQEAFAHISLYAVHPGMVQTELGRDAGWFPRLLFFLLGTSLQKGAETHIHLIDTAPGKLVSGEYYAKGRVTKTTPQAYDLEEARKLSLAIQAYLKPYLPREEAT